MSGRLPPGSGEFSEKSSAGNFRAVAGRTCFFDSLRLLFQGVLDASFLSLGLLVAIRVFHGSNGAKGLLSSLVWLGGIFAPPLTRLAARSRWKCTHCAALLFLLCAACFVGVASARSFPLYVLLLALASVLFRVEGALMVGIYVANYDARRRASRLSLGLVLSATMAVAFGHGSGILLNRSLDLYRHLFLAVALCSVLCALFTVGIPSGPVRRPSDGPTRYLPYLIRDRLFGKMTFLFFLVGVAYQMLIPIRMEYLANPAYGADWDNFSILLLVCVIPNVARILSTAPLAILFDRARLITTRLTVNGAFFLGIVTFFGARRFPLLALGSAFLGIAMAGSFVMHGLWPTKFVPAEKLPAYTSIYLMVSGFRSVCAPVFAYALLSIGSPIFVAWVAGLLLLAASLGFWSLRREPALR
jgi:MFS family permease